MGFVKEPHYKIIYLCVDVDTIILLSPYWSRTFSSWVPTMQVRFSLVELELGLDWAWVESNTDNTHDKIN